MKMSVGTRIIFSLFMLVIILLCVGIILAAFGVIAATEVQALLNGLLLTDFKYIWAGAALLIIVLCICLLFFGIRKKTPVPRGVVLEENISGNVEITTDALRELADTYLRTLNGIIINGISVVPIGFRSIRLEVRICVRPEVEIPPLTEKITAEIKEHFMTYAGISADEVRIRIMPMKNQLPQA